jgi:hypothetical protein
MHAAHIIPFLLNKFDDKAINSRQIVRGVFFLSLFMHRCLQTDTAHTWDMLRPWARIDFMSLMGSNINSPTNTIYMSWNEHRLFGRFDFYLDKEAVTSLFVLLIPSLAQIISVSGHTQQVQSTYDTTRYASE